jgi:hypothetical protein
MLYQEILRACHDCDLKYVVVGGIAVNLHGYQRATGDLDIAIVMTDEEIHKFIKMVQMIGFVPRVPVKIEDLADLNKRKDWIENKNMKVFSVYNPKKASELVDLMIESPVEFETLYKNRVMVGLGDIKIPIASIPDLIHMKEHAGRGRDKIDIEALRKIEEIKNEK